MTGTLAIAFPNMCLVSFFSFRVRSSPDTSLSSTEYSYYAVTFGISLTTTTLDSEDIFMSAQQL
jgi:hypothetical protein